MVSVYTGGKEVYKYLKGLSDNSKDSGDKSKGSSSTDKFKGSSSTDKTSKK